MRFLGSIQTAIFLGKLRVMIAGLAEQKSYEAIKRQIKNLMIALMKRGTQGLKNEKSINLPNYFILYCFIYELECVEMKFEIGEMAVFIADIEDPTDVSDYTGMDCEIIDPLGTDYSGDGDPCYGVKFKDNKEMWVIEPCLKKKKPPEEEIDWVEKLELKNWNPTKQGIEV